MSFDETFIRTGPPVRPIATRREWIVFAGFSRPAAAEALPDRLAAWWMRYGSETPDRPLGSVAGSA